MNTVQFVAMVATSTLGIVFVTLSPRAYARANARRCTMRTYLSLIAVAVLIMGATINPAMASDQANPATGEAAAPTTASTVEATAPTAVTTPIPAPAPVAQVSAEDVLTFFRWQDGTTAFMATTVLAATGRNLAYYNGMPGENGAFAMTYKVYAKNKKVTPAAVAELTAAFGKFAAYGLANNEDVEGIVAPVFSALQPGLKAAVGTYCKDDGSCIPEFLEAVREFADKHNPGVAASAVSAVTKLYERSNISGKKVPDLTAALAAHYAISSMPAKERYKLLGMVVSTQADVKEALKRAFEKGKEEGYAAGSTLATGTVYTGDFSVGILGRLSLGGNADKVAGRFVELDAGYTPFKFLKVGARLGGLGSSGYIPFRHSDPDPLTTWDVSASLYGRPQYCFGSVFCGGLEVEVGILPAPGWGAAIVGDFHVTDWLYFSIHGGYLSRPTNHNGGYVDGNPVGDVELRGPQMGVGLGFSF